jgi:hypothetical protein
MNLPYVPCLVDRTAVSGGMSESDGAIVIDSVDIVWAFILRLAILALLMLLNHHSIANIVLVGETLRVLLFVVLKDKSLATFLDILPVRLKANVVNCIAIEHKLRLNTSWAGVARKVVWTVACIAKPTAIRIPSHVPLGRSWRDLMF